MLPDEDALPAFEVAAAPVAVALPAPVDVVVTPDGAEAPNELVDKAPGALAVTVDGVTVARAGT